MKKLLVGVFIFAFFMLPMTAGSATEPIASRAAGRYQVVNGTPEFAKNIMLLDTQTGQTWIICEDEKKNASWCAMHRYDEGTFGPREP